METLEVTKSHQAIEEHLARAKNAHAWLLFYSEVDSLGKGKIPEIAEKYGFDISTATQKYQQREEKKALKQQGTIQNSPVVRPDKSVNSGFNLVQFKKRDEQIETEKIPSETPVVEQIFVEPVSTSPTKRPLRLYDVTNNMTKYADSGTGNFCEDLTFLPISKEYIRGKYGGGVFIVREVQTDGKETLPLDVNGKPLSPIEIAMTLEDQKRRMLLKETNQIIAQNVSKDATPAEKMIFEVVGAVAKQAMTPQPAVDPTTQLNSIIQIMNQLRPQQIGLSETDKRTNERLDTMQMQLIEAREAVFKKEIEFLRERIADKKVNASGAEIIKDVVTKTITEMGIKGGDQEDEGWLTTAFKTAAKSEATVNKALDILQGVGFAIMQAVTKQPVNNNPAPPAAINEQKALSESKPSEPVNQNPVSESSKTQQDQLNHYQQLDKEQSEKDIIKLIKMVMNAPEPSATQVDWMLNGEAIPFIFPVEVNEINGAINETWKAMAEGNQDKVKIGCDLIRQAFGKFKEPLNNVFASAQGKAFIEGIIKNYVLEE